MAGSFLIMENQANWLFTQVSFQNLLPPSDICRWSTSMLHGWNGNNWFHQLCVLSFSLSWKVLYDFLVFLCHIKNSESAFSRVSFLDEVSGRASAAAKNVYSIYFSLLIEGTPLPIYSVCKMKLYCRIEVFATLKHQRRRPIQRRGSGVAVEKRTDLSPFLVAHALSVENTNCEEDKRLTLTTPVNTNSCINSMCSYLQNKYGWITGTEHGFEKLRLLFLFHQRAGAVWFVSLIFLSPGHITWLSMHLCQL